MPIHDWTRVRANRFHDFHQSWTIAIRNALNAGQLPSGYFAMVEQKAGGPEPDVITLELTAPPGPPATPGLAEVRLRDPQITRTIGILTRRNASLSPAAADLMALVRRQIRGPRHA